MVHAVRPFRVRLHATGTEVIVTSVVLPALGCCPHTARIQALLRPGSSGTELGATTGLWVAGQSKEPVFYPPCTNSGCRSVQLTMNSYPFQAENYVVEKAKAMLVLLQAIWAQRTDIVLPA